MSRETMDYIGNSIYGIQKLSHFN